MMTNTQSENTLSLKNKSSTRLFIVLILIGIVAFFIQAAGRHPEKAWQAYLINLLLFSAISQGGLLFSALMYTVKAKWSGPLSGLAESLAAFFPISLVLFCLLFLGKNYLFPWLGANLNGKETWLNIPFLFTRDFIGLIILYGLGLVYLYHSLYFKIESDSHPAGIRGFLIRRWQKRPPVTERYRQRMAVLAVLYMLAFAFILSLLGYDLVMSMDPHWYSTLFGAYTFVKAIYVGLGAVIILATLLDLSPHSSFKVNTAQLHDITKLFFAFCLVWADFFYAQLVVIWYGNISEETSYVIERTMHSPWNALAWTVFALCFIGPFLILINKKIKTIPKAMLIICSVVTVGLWLEHFLLLRPVYYPEVKSLPFHFVDVTMTLGFFGLLALVVTRYLNAFPELTAPIKEVN
jgi:Ni/Fe-hydrogenase subunit HybB-like protein